ncbi:MAG: hypothetical protein KF724_07410 [Phycisphaeraceae bacterium]|nr:hypothetical protein [Phycisphaeraceae bacterium]
MDDPTPPRGIIAIIRYIDRESGTVTPTHLSGAKEHTVEFISYSEAWPALQLQGLEEADRNDRELHLGLLEDERVVVIDVAANDHRLAATLPGTVLRVPREAMPAIVEGVVHKLRIDPVLLIPVGHWRDVFDAVSFEMAENAPWKAIDQMASVELNTRDPLLLGPGDHHTLRDLVRALLKAGSNDTQGISVAATGTKILIEVLPCGQMIVFAGNPHLGAQVREVIDHAAANGPGTPSPDSEKRAPQRPHS